MPMSTAEFRHFQGLIDTLDTDWLPDCYYTLSLGLRQPLSDIVGELTHAMRPFLGVAITPMSEMQMQSAVDNVVRNRHARGELLIWSNLEGKPGLIDSIGVCHEGYGNFKLRPMLDRTKIMDEFLAELGNR